MLKVLRVSMNWCRLVAQVDKVGNQRAPRIDALVRPRRL